MEKIFQRIIARVQAKRPTRSIFDNRVIYFSSRLCLRNYKLGVGIYSAKSRIECKPRISWKRIIGL